jgi:hypothetical protein
LYASNSKGIGEVSIGADNIINISSGNVTFTSGNLSLGDISFVHINGGNSGEVLSTDGSGNLSWISAGGGGSLGNLEVVGTTIQIANSATENSINIGNGAAGLIIESDSGSPIVNLYANTTDSETYYAPSDYTTGTYTSDGFGGGTITLSGAPTIETFFNDLRGTIVTVRINETETIPYNGSSYGGGTVNISTSVPPNVDPTDITTIRFNIAYQSKFLLDPDEGDMGIYIGNDTFDIESDRDIRITARDDFSIESYDNFYLQF